MGVLTGELPVLRFLSRHQRAERIRTARELEELATEVAWADRAHRIADQIHRAHDTALSQFEARLVARANQQAARSGKLARTVVAAEGARAGARPAPRTVARVSGPKAASAATGSARSRRGSSAGTRGARTVG